MPRGSRDACQRSPVAVTVAPSRGTPATRSVPWCTGGAMPAPKAPRGSAALAAVPGIQAVSEVSVSTTAVARASLVARLHGQLRKAGGSRSRWAAKRSSHMATTCVVVSVAAVFGSSRAAW